MKYYQTSGTTYHTYDAPEDRSPLEWRPSLEKGEETHVRDCMTWHGPSPRYTYRNHNYRMYTHDGRDYWTSQDCGNPGCRKCNGEDILTAREVGFVRRNELGRTIDRGFSSKPRKLRMQEDTGDYGDGSWTQRFNPQPETAREGGGMRDPFNRPVGDYDKPWMTSRYGPDTHYRGDGGSCCGRGCHGYKGDCAGKSCSSRGPNDCKDCYSGCSGGAKFNGGAGCLCNGRGCPGCTGNARGGNDLNTYRATFPRIDAKDPGSISYRPLGGTGPAAIGYNRPVDDDFDSRPVGGVAGGGGGATYRSPPPQQQSQPDFDSGFQGTTNPSMTNGIGGGNGGFGGAGGATRGNDVAFPRKDDPSSKRPVGPRRELKGPNTAVAFTV